MGLRIDDMTPNFGAHTNESRINFHQKVAVLMSLMFLPTAFFKLTDFFLAVEFFTKWGIPLWMMHFIGASELAGAIGLLVPRTRPAAAFALFLLMIGGLVTHLTHGEYFFAVMPVIYGAGLSVLMKDWPPQLPVRQAAPSAA